MFPSDTPMTLTDVTFTTEVVDDETRRVVECTLKLSPFTPAQAEALNVRSVLFETATGLPKPLIDAAVLQIDIPLQRLTFKMAPDQTEASIIFDDVKVEDKLRVKVKHDRDPVVCDAVMKVNFRYPSATDLLYIANGVNDTHYLTFDAQQGALTLEDDIAAVPPRLRGKELRPGVHAEH